MKQEVRIKNCSPSSDPFAPFARCISAGLLLLTCCLIFIFLAGCATSSGSTFEKTQKSITKEKESYDEGAEKEESKEGVLLKVTTSPSGASVWLNSSFMGTTPLELTEEDIAEGQYNCRILKKGYYPESQWVRLSPERKTVLHADLEEITGYVNVRTVPRHSEVLLGETSLDQGMNELPVGIYSVTVRAFGYEEEEFSLVVEEDSVSEVIVTLEPANFRIKDFSASKKRFNPRNFGHLGRTVFRVEVSSPGEGTITLYNQTGEAVWSSPAGPFTTWVTEVEWDGRNEKGDFCADGTYTALLQAGGREAALHEERIELTLDSSLVYRLRSQWSGPSGLLYCPTPDSAPPGTVTIGSLILGHVEEVQGSIASRIPAQLYSRVGIVKGLEAGIQATAIFNSTGTTPFSFGGSVKYAFLTQSNTGVFSAAALANATYQHGDAADTQTNFTGFSLGVPLGLHIGPVGIVITPQLVLSPLGIHYGGSAKQGFFVWSYGRTGLVLDLPGFSAGLSMALRTHPFKDGFLLHYPISLGAEAHWMLPNTPIFLSAGIAGEVESGRDFYVLGGLGGGIIP